MPKTVTVLRVFIASPRDVSEERLSLEEVIKELNTTWGQRLGIYLELVKWETHACPGTGEYPQEVINKQINDYDIFIGILWKTFGTPTPKADSGTAEEFNIAYERYLKDPNQLRILFYFKDAPISPSEIDPEQLKLINDFRKKLNDKGFLYANYKDLEQFNALVRIHLSRQVQEWQKDWGDKQVGKQESSELEIPIEDELDIDIVGDEEGFLDLIEDGQENMKKLTEATLRISDAVEKLGNKMIQRTAELNQISNSEPDNIKMIKHNIKSVAEDMDNFVFRMKTELPIFSKSYSKALDAFARSIPLMADFEVGTEKGIKESLEMIGEFKKHLTGSRDRTAEFKMTVDSLPRITTVFNRSKKNASYILDKLINEMTSAVNMTVEIEKMLEKMKGEETAQ